MESIWIAFAVMAAMMQAVRTAAQKNLNQHMSTMSTTYVRSLAGLPFIALFLGAVLLVDGGGVPRFSARFLTCTLIGAVSQVLATALLVHMFTLRSFAVGTMLTKSDIIMTAVIGSLLFSEQISSFGWCALAVVLAGGVLMLAGKFERGTLSPASLRRAAGDRATRVALGCALLFTLSYLFFREATLALQPGGFLWRGTWTVFIALGLQTILFGGWLGVREPGAFRAMWPYRRLITFIGVTSALGSIGWFAAFALENASFVRAVGQVEAVFTLAISRFYFRERITGVEFIGIVTVIAGVLMFRIV